MEAHLKNIIALFSFVAFVTITSVGCNSSSGTSPTPAPSTSTAPSTPTPTPVIPDAVVIDVIAPTNVSPLVFDADDSLVSWIRVVSLKERLAIRSITVKFDSVRDHSYIWVTYESQNGRKEQFYRMNDPASRFTFENQFGLELGFLRQPGDYLEIQIYTDLKDLDGQSGTVTIEDIMVSADDGPVESLQHGLAPVSFEVRQRPRLKAEGVNPSRMVSASTMTQIAEFLIHNNGDHDFDVTQIDFPVRWFNGVTDLVIPVAVSTGAIVSVVNTSAVTWVTGMRYDFPAGQTVPAHRSRRFAIWGNTTASSGRVIEFTGGIVSAEATNGTKIGTYNWPYDQYGNPIAFSAYVQ